jgi:hypothetical protein
MTDRQRVAHATPAWIIPVVGVLHVPLAREPRVFPLTEIEPREVLTM